MLSACRVRGEGRGEGSQLTAPAPHIGSRCCLKVKVWRVKKCGWWWWWWWCGHGAPAQQRFNFLLCSSECQALHPGLVLPACQEKNSRVLSDFTWWSKLSGEVSKPISSSDNQILYSLTWPAFADSNKFWLWPRVDIRPIGRHQTRSGPGTENGRKTWTFPRVVVVVVLQLHVNFTYIIISLGHKYSTSTTSTNNFYFLTLQLSANARYSQGITCTPLIDWDDIITCTGLSVITRAEIKN